MPGDFFCSFFRALFVYFYSMNIFLDESLCKGNLVPFSYTRHVSDIRVGIFTIKEKWEKLTSAHIYLDENIAPGNCIRMDAHIIPSKNNFTQLLEGNYSTAKRVQYPWDIYLLNDWAIRNDLEMLQPFLPAISSLGTNQIINPGNVYADQTARLNFSMINASAGPVYIGKNAEVMEGSMLRGPLAICDNAVVKMGAKIYGATTIGPNCVVGGEIKNTVLLANSNKAHDGYLGDTVIGEWCNLGAGTSNSNVKNTASAVKFFLHDNEEGIDAGSKAGLLMGDYSRCAINTTFNTGTTVGVCCNIFGPGMLPKFTGNFLWGKERYIFEKAIKDIDNWKKFKGSRVTEYEIASLKKLYHHQ